MVEDALHRGKKAAFKKRVQELAMRAVKEHKRVDIRSKYPSKLHNEKRSTGNMG